MKHSQYLREPATADSMKTAQTKFAAIVQSPVYPKALHQFRPDPKAVKLSPQTPKRDNIFSQSRDERENRGTRGMKTSRNAQSFPHVR
jgi:hypothetical protein